MNHGEPVTRCAMYMRIQDVPCICVYLDDMLVTGKSPAEHLKNLNEVLTRLEKAGMKLKKNK